MDKAIDWDKRRADRARRTDLAVRLLTDESPADDDYLWMTIRNVINGDPEAFDDWCRMVD